MPVILILHAGLYEAKVPKKDPSLHIRSMSNVPTVSSGLIGCVRPVGPGFIGCVRPVSGVQPLSRVPK